MAQTAINVGVVANDGSGDGIRVAGVGINANFTELFAKPSVLSHISFEGNNIKSTLSNADISLSGNGSGGVTLGTNVTIDSNINLTDNKIKTTISNSDLELSASGSGNVVINPVDINGGAIDNTIIGGATPLAGTFTTITAPTISSSGVTITDNKITASQSNDNLEFTASGTGYITINEFQLPNSDGNTGQVLKTNGSKTLSWFSPSVLLGETNLDDGTATINSSSATVIDSFTAATYRSAKYNIQIVDATASRYEMLEANVTHDGTTAYVSTFGRTNSHTEDLVTLTADINSGSVRLLGTINNSNSHVLKFVRRIIKI